MRIHEYGLPWIQNLAVFQNSKYNLYKAVEFIIPIYVT